MPLRMIRVERDAVGHGMELQWSAIFTGAFLTLGLSAFFLLLGNAIGLSVQNVRSPTVGGTLRFWSWIYMAGTLIFSYYMGNFLATRSNAILSAASGSLHGMASWGLATALAVGALTISSPLFRTVLFGTGSNAAEWFLVCVIGLGFLAATLGGASGKQAVRYYRREEGRVVPETQRKAA